MKFTPEISYLLGLWIHCKYSKGVGVAGRARDVFVSESIKLGFTEPKKVQYTKDAVFFYQNRVKNMLKKLEASRKARLRFANEYSASYLAGWFDCCGDVKDKSIKLCNADIVDKFILNELNFRFLEKKKDVYILKPLAFLRFIRDYTKLKASQPP